MSPLRTSIALSALIMTSSLMLGACSSSHAAQPTPTTSGATTTPGSTSDALAHSLDITTIPADLTPPLSDFTSPSTAWPATARSIVSRCDAYSNPKLQSAPTPCLLGDPTGTKTIVLAGDSNAAGWAPALDQGLRSSGYRLAVFPFSGCPVADMTYTGLINGQSSSKCNTWHSSVTSAILGLHPDAVILASVASIPGVDLTTPQWSAGIKKFFDAVSTGANPPARILFGTYPQMVANIPECLSAHANPQDCSVTGRYWQLFQANTLERDRRNAQVASAHLIPAVQWLCAPKGCSPVIGTTLVYVDADHLTMAYSLSIATPVTRAVLDMINPGQSSTTSP